jgi:hypothetical protein
MKVHKRVVVLAGAVVFIVVLSVITVVVLRNRSSNRPKIITDTSKPEVVVTYNDDPTHLSTLNASDQIDQLMRKVEYLRTEGKNSEALSVLDGIESKLSIEGWELAIYSARIRLYSATGDVTKKTEYETKLKIFLVSNGTLKDSDPLPDVNTAPQETTE